MNEWIHYIGVPVPIQVYGCRYVSAPVSNSYITGWLAQPAPWRLKAMFVDTSIYNQRLMWTIGGNWNIDSTMTETDPIVL